MTQTPTPSRHRVVPLAVLATLGATTAIAAPAPAVPLPRPSVSESAPQPVTAAAPARGQSTYTVRSGDTLGHIAMATGVAVADLRAANGLTGNRIVAGRTLTIPSASGSGRSSGAAVAGTSSGSGHTVRAGDTLSGIAQLRGISVSALQSANPGLEPRALRPGQNITLPSGSGSSRSSSARVPGTFLGRTYPAETVRSANVNKQALHERSVPGRDRMRQIIADAARRHGVEPALAQAVAHQESGFNMRAVSSANAIGAMQVIPSSGEWASRMAGRTLDLMDPHDNATAGVLILRAHQRTGADEATVLASYYQGRGSVTRNGMYPDTRRYVANVQTLKGRY